MSDTPETDAQLTTFGSVSKLGKHFTNKKGTVSAEFARKLERERDESRNRAIAVILERDRWKMLAEEKVAMRRELEELLGVAEGPTCDEQFFKGLYALRQLIRERDEAHAECLEQARLLSMGGEREARLTTERNEARHLADSAMWEADCCRSALNKIASMDTSQDASPQQCGAVLIAMNALHKTK
jgi:hypothetical protein